MQLQTDEQRGKRACALTARGSISEALKGLVGGAAQGFSDCHMIPRSSVSGTHPTSAECDEAARGRYKAARSAMREQGRNWTNRYRVAPSRPIGADECSGPHRRMTRTFGRNRLLRGVWAEEASVSRT